MESVPEYLPKIHSTTVVREIAPLTVSEVELIRRDVLFHQKGILLSSAPDVYRLPLRSYLAAELLRSVENPAVKLRAGQKAPPWVGGKVGEVGSPEEALFDVAEFGAGQRARIERELGPDAPTIVKSIQEKGVNIPLSRGEHRDLYLRVLTSLSEATQLASIRYNSSLTDEGERYRVGTYGYLERTPTSGLIIPQVSQLEPVTIEAVLPDVTERSDNPWKKIEDYAGFMESLDTRLRSGLNFATNITSMGLRRVFAPALRQTAPKV